MINAIQLCKRKILVILLITNVNIVANRKSEVNKSICSGCGKMIKFGSTCACRKTVRMKYRKQYEQKNAEHKKLLNSARWKKFRKYIINRDKFSCQRCIIKYNIVETENLQVHHIKPRSKYIELMFDEDNCITMCKACNTHIGTKEELDFNFTPNEREFIL